MGFLAPSAELAHQYALRQDGMSRSVTDRFGWSILLVGDYSEASHEFLQKYCLDLCARTADRVRFVFFSDLPTDVHAHIAFEERGKNSQYGLLGGVLKMLRGRRRTDFRAGRWDVLRPAAFSPVLSERQILAHLDRTRLENSAVPGAKAGLRFAQLLGIGGHVPCLVMFTDVGERKVHVLPFGSRTADEVYVLVRRWIDEYYEVNHTRLQRWTAVEKRVEAMVRPLSGSLSEIREWSNRKSREWQQLRLLATLSSAAPRDLVDVERVLSARPPLPEELWGPLSSCRDRIVELERVGSARRQLATACTVLASAEDDRTIRRTVNSLARNSEGLSDHTAAVVTSARKLFVREGATALRDWRNNNGRLFAKSAFAAARQPWKRIAERGRLRESSKELVRRDYAVFLASVVAQPLALPAGEIADAALTALATHYAVTDQDEWAAATADFRASLTDAVDRIRSTAPPECAVVGHCLSNMPPPVCTLTDAQRQMRDETVRALRNDMDLFVDVEPDLRAALAAVPVLVEPCRADLEARLVAAVPPGLAASAKAEMLAELAEALEDYENAVREVVYPHQADPAAIPVTAPLPVSEAFPGWSWRGHLPPATDLSRAAASTITAYRSHQDSPWRPPRDLVFNAEVDPLGPVSAEAASRLRQMVERNAFDVFMAHHSGDKPAVHDLCRLLRRHGVHPWLDEEQVRPGTWFQEALQSAIRSVRSAAICLGNNGVGRWQQLELQAFVERCVAERIPVIPVLLPGVAEPPEELLFLRQLNVVRFDRSVFEAEPLRRLVWGVTGQLPG